MILQRIRFYKTLGKKQNQLEKCLAIIGVCGSSGVGIFTLIEQFRDLQETMLNCQPYSPNFFLAYIYKSAQKLITMNNTHVHI